MGLRHFLLVTLVPAAVAAAVSCAPLQVNQSGGDRAASGAGGAIAGQSTGNGTGTGTGGAPSGDAGPALKVMGPLTYLCGGSQAHCSPDPGSEDCTPGGSAGLG